MTQESVKHEPTIQDPNSNITSGGPEVKEELSKVAFNPKRNIAVFATMAIGFGVMAYNLIAPQIFNSGSKTSDAEQQVTKPDNIAKPASQALDAAPPIPQLPEPPKLVAPTPSVEDKIPSLPNAAPAETAMPVVEASSVGPGASMPAVASPIAPPGVGSVLDASGDDAKKRLENKRKAPIQLMGGDGKAKQGTKIAAEEQQSMDFKKRGDLNYVLGQGKVIDVITETAINSDMPGEVRAVVTRDVFSQSGKVILIPKGTRVFGSFSTSVSGGYGRIDIKWSRIDLDSGYMLNLVGDSVDNLGRKGVQGVVDNKYPAQLTNAVLTSAFNIGLATGLDKIIPPVASSQGAVNATLATNVQNTAMSIYNNGGVPTTVQDDQQKANTLCTTIQGLITDKSSSSYLTLVQACTTALGTTNAQPGQISTAVMSAITAAATSLISATTAATTPTQKQIASQQAFKDLSSEVQGMVKQQVFTPTTTIDQGHPVKIYVSKDYLFPKDAVIKSKVLQ